MELSNKPLIVTARILASKMHEGMFQERESGDIRYQIIHLQEVADLVWASGGSDEEIASAWLHDSLEDTKLTHDEVVLHCGATVGELVHSLTDFDEWTNLPLLERKSLQAERVKNESDSVKRIKLSDQISNVRSLAIDPPVDMLTPNVCASYIEGARRIADACKGTHPSLDRLFDSAYERATTRFGKMH